jgi:O-antigen biosynthesis protein
MSEPRVSVITRTYNRPRMLRRALESVARQSWKNREVVVVNDGGEDVAPILAELAGRLDIVYLNFGADEKPGRCLAATKGIEAATGEWIAYLDDDDVYYPDHLESIVNAALAADIACVYSDGMVGEETKDGESGQYALTLVRPGASEEFSRARFYTGCYIHLSTFAHKKTLFQQHGGFDPELPVLEDLDLFYRYSQDVDFLHLKKFTTQYHLRDDETNAVTKMRREFRETKEILARKYLHIAVSDMMRYIVEGQARLLQVAGTVEALARRMEALEEKAAALERRGLA